MKILSLAVLFILSLPALSQIQLPQYNDNDKISLIDVPLFKMALLQEIKLKKITLCSKSLPWYIDYFVKTDSDNYNHNWYFFPEGQPLLVYYGPMLTWQGGPEKLTEVKFYTTADYKSIKSIVLTTYTTLESSHINTGTLKDPVFESGFIATGSQTDTCYPKK